VVGDVELHDAAADRVETRRRGLDRDARRDRRRAGGGQAAAPLDLDEAVQEAGRPPRPSISTRQRRQEPKALRLSLAQSLGIATPSPMAARMIDVPSGTLTSWPSIVSVTILSDVAAGVPWSISLMSAMTVFLLGSGPGPAIRLRLSDGGARRKAR
jgi:hypothetical protein